MFLAAPAAAQQLPVVELRAGMHLIRAEVAADYSTRGRGLMFRKSLAPNSGMLFIFDAAEIHCMWMKNTYIPLSVAFVDAQGTIINIADMQPHSEQSHCAARPALLRARDDAGLVRRARRQARHEARRAGQDQIRNIEAGDACARVQSGRSVAADFHTAQPQPSRARAMSRMRPGSSPRAGPPRRGARARRSRRRPRRPTPPDLPEPRCLRSLQAAVLLRDHAIEHRDRQHGVEARGHPGHLGGGRLFFGAHRARCRALSSGSAR